VVADTLKDWGKTPQVLVNVELGCAIKELTTLQVPAFKGLYTPPLGAAGMLHTALFTVSRPRGLQVPPTAMEVETGLAMVEDREVIGFGPQSFDAVLC
jgi:hypothetical protein